MKHKQISIEGCIENDPRAQSLLFKKYFHKMFGICLRFAKNPTDAEDILQEGFIKVFANLQTFRSEGSLENWMRRIMINTSYNFYKRKYPPFSDMDFETLELPRYKNLDAIDQMSEKDILDLVDKLPEGYQRVFNMSAIEGYTHQEIGNKLKITKGTSKSQLNRAKTCLKKKLLSLLPPEELTTPNPMLAN
ncbi:MAG: sigma-70 family RNA polymerase sigma factor [Bacteroidales bacterium]|nr:sigma-70 family RNA polymerase sigma factor [Bacteroidales bacterium]MCF8345071.1 sigma-70 family RNA polymerase sigma factor [Bacteroidales bacterium]MCF8350990.1 sigma-70 family RNA polymerase sigma factor [Bacteroidales bacterium]MCF8376114.1 sigma-70 family RNA polymerase sigma factor [Bacteroidales bacterium]MCF8401427.1 sigma-70 family RNA polymerase sigma factor [Bacteroidales bacterium]